MQDNMELTKEMNVIGQAARAASFALRNSTPDQHNQAINFAATLIESQTDEILRANEKDMQQGRDKGLTEAMLDRLLLTPERLTSIANSLRQIADMPNILGEVITTLTPPNGLKIERVRVPIGVIGIIYESRPNVTADAGALCLKSGNSVILRGGSESFHSSLALHACLATALERAGLPETAIQYVNTTDRQAVGEMLSGLDGSIDMIVPRGGKSLVARVESEARVPVLSHLDGICHTYVDKDADLDMATQLMVNAKMRRTGVCGATETMLIHADVLDSHLGQIVHELSLAGCSLRGDDRIRGAVPKAKIESANDEDWDTEYLTNILSIACVDSLEDAIAHIGQHSSNHTDCIITDNMKTAQQFLGAVDSAIVMHNASTQFADGGEFGLGAEIGIATGRLHARGPVGAEGLTTYKYRVSGTGQSRP